MMEAELKLGPTYLRALRVVVSFTDMIDAKSAPAAIRRANIDDVPAILWFIRQLAIYEKLEHQVVATEDGLRASLFGPRPMAEVVLAEHDGHAVGFALFFPNYSTFLGRPGLYLEDLFVRDEYRGRGVGRQLLAAPRGPRARARLGPHGMGGARLERSRLSASIGGWAQACSRTGGSAD